jgi:hypothetical protein
VIVYTFGIVGRAAQYVFDYVTTRSPVRTGRFQSSWIIVVDGNVWEGPTSMIPPRSTVWVTNTQPYARKIEVGHMRMNVDRHICENARTAANKAFPSLTAGVAYLDIPDGAGGGYILKGVFRRGFREKARTNLNKDVRAGEKMTYPSVTLTTRF